MKKLLLFLLLTPFFSNAQVVNTILRKNTATKTIYSYSSGSAGNDTLANVYKLDDFTEGQVPSWDATNKRFIASTVSLAGINTYVFTRTNSDISGYKQAASLNNYVEGLRDTATAGASTTPVLLQEFATNAGYPNITVIPIGEFNVFYETKKDAGTQNYWTYAIVYKRSLAGTETVIDTTEISSVTSDNTLKNVDISFLTASNITLLSTDRIVVKVYARMQSGTANISLYSDDATYARLTLPAASVDATNFVPYVGATKDTDLGVYGLSANTLSLSGTSPDSRTVLNYSKNFTLDNISPFFGISSVTNFSKTGTPFDKFAIGNVSNTGVSATNNQNWLHDGSRVPLTAYYGQIDGKLGATGRIPHASIFNAVAVIEGARFDTLSYFHAQEPKITSGDVGLIVGLLTDSITAANPDSAYAIYSKGGKTRLGGNLEILTSDKVASFHRQGNSPSFAEFWYDNPANGTSKVSVGMLGSPEANLSFNMDYTEGWHNYYDSSKGAMWEYLNASGWGIQHMKAGLPTTTDPYYPFGGETIEAFPVYEGDTTKGGTTTTLRLRLRNYQNNKTTVNSLLISQDSSKTKFTGSTDYIFDNDLRIKTGTYGVVFDESTTVPTIKSTNSDGTGSQPLYIKGTNVLFSGNGSTESGRFNTSGDFEIGSNIDLIGSSGVGLFTDVQVSDEAYGAGWNGSLEVPTKNAVYDKIEASLPNLSSGTYTPTLTNGTNVASSIAGPCKYTRIGNIVTVYGKISITPTSGSTAPTDIQISLPIASNIGSGSDVSGYGSANALALNYPYIEGDAANNTAELNVIALMTGDNEIYFSFSYEIL